MKTKHSLTYFVGMLIFAFIGNANVKAQFIKQEIKSNSSQCEKKLLFDVSKYKKEASADGNFLYFKKILPSLQQSSETFTITPDPQYDPERFLYTMALIYSRAENQFIASFIDDDGNNTSVDLPAGMYDLVVSFDSNEDNSTSYFVIKEGIEVQKDSTWSFSPAEAKNYVTTEIYTEEGQVLKAGGENTGQAAVDCGIYLHGIAVGSFSTWSFVDFYISDVKNIRIAETIGVNKREGMTQGEYYINKLQHTGEVKDDLVLRNNPEDYKIHTEYFRRGPKADIPAQVERSNIELESWTIFDSESMMCTTSTFISTSDSTSLEKDYFETYPIHLYLNNPLQDLSEENPCNILASTAIVETLDTLECMEFDGELYYLTKGRAILSPRLALGENKEIVYVNASASSFSDTPTGKEIYNFYPVPDNPIMLNSTCQVQLFPYSSYQNDLTGEYKCFEPIYIGNYGEVHETPYDAKVIYNGETIFVGDTLASFLENWEKEEQHKGKFEITTTLTNLFVNNDLGKNTTTITYDNTKQDGEFPRLQMVQFRDKAGNVTNRFNEISDMKILFSIGDFDYDGWQFKYKKAENITISYSLQGEDNWKELSYSKLQSGSEAFGDTYQSSLEKEINGNNNQWFDLKIESSDKNNNSQTQVFSPAFYIINPNSIETLTNGTNTVFINNNTIYSSNGFDQIEIYNLSGQKIKSIEYAGSSYKIERLANGIYIVKIYIGGEIYNRKAIFN